MLKEFKEKEKLNPTYSAESREKLLERLDWTDTLLTEHEKQAVELKLNDCYDIFAIYRKNIGANTAFKVKLTHKDHKTVYSQKPTNTTPLEKIPNR